MPNRSVQNTFFIAALLLSLAGCAAEGAPNGSTAVADGNKSDESRPVSFDDPSVLTLECDLETCAFELTLWGDYVEGITLVAGTEDETREALAQFNDERQQTVLEEIPFEDILGPAQFRTMAKTTVERGTTWIAIYSPYAMGGERYTLEQRLRLPLDDADELSQAADGAAFSTEGSLAGGVHRWRAPVTDTWTDGNPTVAVALSGDVSELVLAVHYQCSAVDEWIPYSSGFASSNLHNTLLLAECNDWDDSGDVYIEVAGTGSYELNIYVEEY